MEDIPKISVIIPTYNRFKYLLNTIKSVKEQTYKNIEIIVVNDRSTQQEYYEYTFDPDVKVITMAQNSKSTFGFVCSGHVRNIGIKEATGEYIAFCDDDDSWFPEKLELQLKAMESSKCNMSCTEGLFGNGIYDPAKTYPKYNSERFYSILKHIYKTKGNNQLVNGFPDRWDLNFLKVHNCMITSSVMIKKKILEDINYFNLIPNSKSEDYECWLRCLEHTDCVYVKDICVYYDARHGDGRNY
jgi:glycosyltransferase involved in cell wall biosynthesis